MKKAIAAGLAVIIMLCVFTGYSVLSALEEESGAGFSGSRCVKFNADKSDLDNFIDGGRAAFDLVLRSSTPSWLSCELSSDGRDLSLTISFTFDTFEDYSAHLTELLVSAPNLVYSAGDEMLLLEGYSAPELLNFLQTILSSMNCLKEKQLSDIFHVVFNEITVNANTHTFEQDRISIRPQNDTAVVFDSLEISTAGKKSGAYSRTITVQIDASVSGEDDVNAVRKRFKKAGKVKDTELSGAVAEISVTFDAKSQKEMTAKTMACLSAADSVSEQQIYVDKSTVGVTRTEFFDLMELLRSEDTPFTYSFEYPSYYNSVSSEDDTVSVTETAVTSRNEAYITFYYERGFAFSSVEITTDMSELFGKKARTVTLTAPVDLAVFYHDRIKEELQEHMVRGTVIDIFDEGGNRYYKLSFSSWFIKEVENFSKSVMNSPYSFDIYSSWLPFGECSLQESLTVNNLISDMAPADEITVRYSFPEIFRFMDTVYEDGNASVSDNSVLFSIGSTDAMRLEYRGIDIVKSTVLALALLVILVVALIVVIKIKKKRKKSKRKKQELNDLSADSHKKDGEPERDDINNTSAEMHLPDKTIDDNCVSQEKDE